MSETLRITEIYSSIQGESSWAGWPCVFIRLSGCPLRCRWCDTVYSFSAGDRMELSAIVEQALQLGLPLVEVTGGEPLAQKNTPQLLTLLADRVDTVLLETAGSHPIDGLDPRVRVILDLKAPGSGESARNLWSNLEHLKRGDAVKIVLADRADYDWSRQVLATRELPAGVPLHLSPVHGELEPSQLAEWIIEDRLHAHLQLQQHKYIWHPEARSV